MRRGISAPPSAGRRPSPSSTFPGLHPDAARWLVANRQLSAIGIDTASIDYGQSTQYESHRVLFERDVPAFENLTALDRLPLRGRHDRRAADEDRRRQRRPVAGDSDSAL